MELVVTDGSLLVNDVGTLLESTVGDDVEISDGVKLDEEVGIMVE